ncbi:competence type IV pilus minor pilin ComGE [Virgibacillus ihumii]|uniref:competence type IV pilus minor pilin ComGE n=1 Tax=Virgibacillus ihumii TaxID=2686091 RepID=UPI00157D56B8|nr:competence type IV pilus minor pilin ComGE [Virgibacillus ihumii]
MRNNKGFSLIETLVALSILVTVITTFIPIKSTIMLHRDILHQKQEVLNSLHEELQIMLMNGDTIPIAAYTINVGRTPVSIGFTVENSLLKGCAEWKNAKNKQQRSCLYGYTSK